MIKQSWEKYEEFKKWFKKQGFTIHQLSSVECNMDTSTLNYDNIKIENVFNCFENYCMMKDEERKKKRMGEIIYSNIAVDKCGGVCMNRDEIYDELKELLK